MSLAKLAIDIAAPLPKIEQFNKYLFVVPHEDDIEIGAGATAAKLAAMGKDITYLICTDGRYGKENVGHPITCEELIKVRYEETKAAAKVCGVSKVIFMGLSDGNQYTYRELLEGIAKVINEVKPDIILSIDPDVPSETHADHLNVGRACKELVNFANYPEIFEKYLPSGVIASKDVNVQAIAMFITNKPNCFVQTRKYFKTQLQALKCYESQYPQGILATKALYLYLNIRSIQFGIRRFCGRAEGFRVLDRTRLHCLPEGSK